MLLRIDPTAAEPIFTQLASQVRAAVSLGKLDPGTRLPAARDLATSLDVNIHTVLRAYQDLRDEGLIELRRGRGAVITQRAASDFTALRRALDAVVVEARRLDLTPEAAAGLLSAAMRPAHPHEESAP